MKIELKENEVLRATDLFNHTSCYFYAQKVVYEIIEQTEEYKRLEISVLNDIGFKEYIYGTVITKYDVKVMENA